MSDSPDPQLIQRLFDEDPLKLSDADLDTIIAYYRADRMNYLQAAKEPKAAKPKGAKLPKADQIDLSEIGL